MALKRNFICMQPDISMSTKDFQNHPIPSKGGGQQTHTNLTHTGTAPGGSQVHSSPSRGESAILLGSSILAANGLKKPPRDTPRILSSVLKMVVYTTMLLFAALIIDAAQVGLPLVRAQDCST